MRSHHCHAVGCDTPISPKLLMCKRHWDMVPTSLRFPVIKAYRKGQCDDRRVTREWLAAAKAAIAYVAHKEGKIRPRTDVLFEGCGE